jgi:hypothetical protein
MKNLQRRFPMRRAVFGESLHPDTRTNTDSSIRAAFALILPQNGTTGYMRRIEKQSQFAVENTCSQGSFLVG